MWTNPKIQNYGSYNRILGNTVLEGLKNYCGNLFKQFHLKNLSKILQLNTFRRTVFGDLIPIKLYFFEEFLLETMEGIITNHIEIKSIKCMFLCENMVQTLKLDFGHTQ
jgi:hypothetical protein